MAIKDCENCGRYSSAEDDCGMDGCFLPLLPHWIPCKIREETE